MMAHRSAVRKTWRKALDFDIVCHCHLRWDFVWQRPQHLMTRMARYHRVLFLEDALPLPEGESTPRMDVKEVQPGLTVARPLLRRHTGDPANDEEVDRLNGQDVIRLVKELIGTLGFEQMIQWLYTPMAHWLARELPCIGVVYDCMDELSMFKNPPPGILDRERELLDAADLVFTGGRSLYLSKAQHHPNVHMFASGVEVEHFAKACDEGAAVPPDMESIGHPRITYTGVIDERLNLELLGAIARNRPEWQFVMIGPVVKIQPEDLPAHPNIHYLGQKPYSELPAYLKGTDVAMMPFAMNDATRFISPTKTLEYMAARRPVVSTPIADVVAYYSRIVWVAEDAAGFEAGINEALGASPERLQSGVEVAHAQTWNSIAAHMNELLEKCLVDKQACTAGGIQPPVR